MDGFWMDLPVDTVKFVGSEYAGKLKNLGILTIKDLIYHFPFRYDDLTQTGNLSHLEENQEATFTGTILKIDNVYTKRGRNIQRAVFSDGTGQIDVTWFNQPFLVKTLRTRPNVSLSGKVTKYRNRFSLVSPRYEYLNSTISQGELIHSGRLVPVYHETSGISSKWLRSRIKPLLTLLVPEIEWLPESIRLKENLVALDVALKSIHFPESSESLTQAINRFAFDELFLLQLAAQLRKRSWQHSTSSHSLKVDNALLQPFIDNLPFTLTKGQQNALEEVVSDLKGTNPMNRLLQGDVGSGKTVIAAAATYLVAKNGLQSVIMAPTEILALQHAKSLADLLSPLGISLSVQTASRKDTVDSAQVIIGTHAVLHRDIGNNVGLVVVDEQHRFGVKQRQKLLDVKDKPHLLSMTATPIPRTVALTLYAEMDISVIDELPIGRKPVTTWVIPPAKRQGAYQWIAKQIATDQTQVFVVCPLIEDSENQNMAEIKAAQSEFEHLSKVVFPELKLGLLHGRMKAQEKKHIMSEFSGHELDILVATPVIEVGIDIKNASIMVIEGAERFGLAQLHQLRGRVGRGDRQSYCLLFTSKGTANHRLKQLEKIHSGFKLAELDFKLRGPGELFGTKQSGYIDLKIASLSDQALILKTYKHAVGLLESGDILSQYPGLNREVEAVIENLTSAN